MMNSKEKVVGKRKYKLSPEHDQPPYKKSDSPRSLSGDEAYYSFSYQSFRGDETDGSSCDDILEMEEEEMQVQEIVAESLQINYKYLVAEMEPLGVIDHLHHSELFSDKFLEECRETPSRRRRNDLVIKEIYKIARNEESDVLQLFTSALIKTEQSFIVHHLREQSTDSAETVRYSKTFLRRFFSFMRDRLIDNMEPRDFIDDLVANKAISFHDHEDITRLDLRKNRVAVIMEKAKPTHIRSAKIIKAIADAYPKLFEEFERRIKPGSAAEAATDPSEGGTAVSIRLHLKSGTIGRRDHLRKIEKRTVERFNKSQPENNEMMNELVEECRCMFQGLKISSVVIQLLTRAGNSLDQVLRKIQSGKAVDWLLSILDENDKRILCQLGVKALEVSVSVDEEGNLSSLIPVQDCICRLDKQSILKHKRSLARALTDTESLIRQLSSFDVLFSHYIKRKAENGSKRSTIILDVFAKEDIPRVCLCLLEEHVKTRDPSLFESLFSENFSEDAELSKTDVKQNEDFLKDELEVQAFLPIIRSWENEKSIRLLAKLSRCPCRSSRMAEFMRFLLCEKDLTWFWEQVKEKQKYIWDTVMYSKRTISQSRTDVLAVQLMNDTVVDEVDPFTLKQYLNEKTIYALGFNEFETILSRKTQAQYMINRITADTIGDFMIALRRCGYEQIFRQIKAGSLAKTYTCPRIHGTDRRKKLIFKDQFDISARLSSYEICTKWKDSVSSTQTEGVPLHYSISYLAPPGSGEVMMSPKSGLRSPASTGSTRDSESGIFSGSEGPACEVANMHEFDDEGISSCSPGASQELDTRVNEPKIETGGVQKKTSRSKKRERMLMLIDSDRSASRSLLQRSPLYISTKRPTFHNCLDIESVEEKTSDGPCDTLASTTEERGKDMLKDKKSEISVKSDMDDEIALKAMEKMLRKRKSSLWESLLTTQEMSKTKKQGLKEGRTLRETPLRTRRNMPEDGYQNGAVPVRINNYILKSPHPAPSDTINHFLCYVIHFKKTAYLCHIDTKKSGTYGKSDIDDDGEIALKAQGKVPQKGKSSLGKSLLDTPEISKTSKKCLQDEKSEIIGKSDIDDDGKIALKAQGQMLRKGKSSLRTSILVTLEISKTNKQSLKDHGSLRRSRVSSTDSEQMKSSNKLDMTERSARASRSKLRSKTYFDEKSHMDDKVSGIKGDDEGVAARKSQKEKSTLRVVPVAWSDTPKTELPNSNVTKRPVRSPVDLVGCNDSKGEGKQSKKKSNTRIRNSLVLKKGTNESDTPPVEARKSKASYKRSLSDTVEPGKHLKSIPNFVKSQSEVALAEYFDTRCSMQTVHEERSVSSPPNDRERLSNHEAKHSIMFPYSRRSLAWQKSVDTD